MFDISDFKRFCDERVRLFSVIKKFNDDQWNYVERLVSKMDNFDERSMNKAWATILRSERPKYERLLCDLLIGYINEYWSKRR